jgi:hypothetical protein
MTKTAPKIQKESPLDDQLQWGSSLSSQPLSPDVLASYQKEIDSVIGTTRDNKSIAKLVWNGDPEYWRTICLEWDSAGLPVTFVKRPIVLYKSVFNEHGKLLYDIPVPRYLILTRIEPEQYVPGWVRDSKVWVPERRQYVQVKPLEPPSEWYAWFMTIASHEAAFCCREAAEQNVMCYGKYADPGLGIAELRTVRKSIDAEGFVAAPFDSPYRLTQKLREQSVNNYVNQAIDKYQAEVNRFISDVPYKDVRQVMRDDLNRDLEEISKTKRIGD